jgi:glycosyltransferase involved in cell wall biosynthesis
VYNSYEDFVRCLESLLTHTPNEADLLFIDDQGADRRFVNLLSGVEINHRAVVLAMPANVGFVGACNAAFEACGSRDVILVNSDVVVSAEWYERLSDAVYSSNVIATATAMTNHGTLLSIPDINQPNPSLYGQQLVDDHAERVARDSLRLRPTIPTAIGHCCYIKRSALNVVGGFSVEFGRGYGEEVDLSQRMISAGFRHVCADDVFVFHRGGGSFGDERSELQEANDRIISARYRYYDKWVENIATDRGSPFALAVDVARIALRGMSIAVDGRCLGPEYMGTQQVVVETVRALSRRSDIRGVRLHVPANISTSTLKKVSNLPGVVVCPPDYPIRDRADVIYRPYQLTNNDELRVLKQWGNRVVVNQLDFIAYHNPFYFESFSKWNSYRTDTRDMLAQVDGVAFISETAQREADFEGLIAQETAQRTVYCGTDLSEISEMRRPKRLAAVDDRPFLLCLGASYHHKNRVQAVRVLRLLRQRGWNGCLVLAGVTPPNGNSLAVESEELLNDKDLSQSTFILGAVSDEERRWLFENCSLTVYLSTVEGFGFVPFESASYGVPCLSSRGGSLAELLPADYPTVDLFDVETAAELAWRFLTEPEFSQKHVDALASHQQAFTWDRTVELLLELFHDSVRSKPKTQLTKILAHEAETMKLKVKADLLTAEIRRLADANEELGLANDALHDANKKLNDANDQLFALNDRLLIGDRGGTWRRWLSWPLRRLARKAGALLQKKPG